MNGQVKDGPHPEPGQSTAPLVEAALRWAYLAIRAVHIVQATICVTSGWKSYRRPRLAGIVLGITVAESTWIIVRSARRRQVDALAARVDTLVGAAGLAGLAAATYVDDRTSSLNWMLPYSVGSTLALGLGVGAGEAWLGVCVLSGTYLGTSVRPGTRPGQVVTAIANAASYAGFHAVGASIMGWVRRAGAELDAARAESVARGEYLAIERERNRQHRILHDSALQTLEGLASGMIGPEAVRPRARTEARRLRRALTGLQPDSDLENAIDQLANEFARHDLEVTYSLDVDEEPPVDVASALIEAAREALRNVTKHAGVNSAVMRAENIGGGVRLTVRDQGKGFDADSVGAGFGLKQSVGARLAEVQGTVDLWSEPGRGTRVTLWVPVT